jgi:3-hydroxy-9,10-secoandrosta-1,3,5(10)-triene-9,17-dione monooxygenase
MPLSENLPSRLGMPNAETFRERVRALQPALRDRAAEANRRRDIPAETIDAFHRAELFELLRPAAFGGFEGDPRVFFDVQNQIAEVCASSAWVYGVLSVQYLILATFGGNAQAEVFAENSRALICSSLQPSGEVRNVEGGYRISGRWNFSSGSTYADWAILGGLVPSEGAGGPPEWRLFLIPRRDYRIDDVWDAFGLRATGSNDIVIAEAFVPAYRSVCPQLELVPMADEVTDKPALYRLPWFYLFTGSVSNLSIGLIRGAVSMFVDTMRTRINGITRKAAKDDAVVGAVAARALAEANAAEATIHRHIEEMLASIETGTRISPRDGLLYRVQLTSITARLATIVDEMQHLMGGRGIRSSSPLVRPWLDIMAARNHPGNDPSVPSGQIAALLFSES